MEKKKNLDINIAEDQLCKLGEVYSKGARSVTEILHEEQRDPALYRKDLYHSMTFENHVHECKKCQQKFGGRTCNNKLNEENERGR